MIEAHLFGDPPSSIRTIVSVQSVSLGGLTTNYLQGLNYFEERNFFLVEALTSTRNRCLVVLSDDIDKHFYERSVALAANAAGINPTELSARWQTFYVPTDGKTSLTQLILSNPMILCSLKQEIAKCPQPILDFWTVSDAEIKLAKELSLAHFGLSEKLIGIDSKSSGRSIFQSLGIPVPEGYSGLSSFAEVRSALDKLASASSADSFLIKLNFEEAGNGIARVPREILDKSDQHFIDLLEVSKNVPVGSFVSEIETQGAVVEEYIVARSICFPSVKMNIRPDGTVENLATHDQILVGMAYSGSRFPSDSAYRHTLIEHGRTVSKNLSEKGLRGIVSLDFAASRNTPLEPWTIKALEINSRKGATTHPYFWSRLLTGAKYSESTGTLSVLGRDVVYRSSEYIQMDGLNKLGVKDLLDALQEAGITYCNASISGVHVHMATCIKRFSKFGATIIGHNHEEVDKLYCRMLEVTREAIDTFQEA